MQQPTAFDPTRNPELSLATTQHRAQPDGSRSATPPHSRWRRRRPAKLGLKIGKNTGNGCQTSGVPFFCDFVLKTILNDKAFGAEKDERLRLLLRGGLTIKTTLDRKMQRAAQTRDQELREPARQGRVRPGVGRAGQRRDQGDRRQPRASATRRARSSSTRRPTVPTAAATASRPGRPSSRSWPRPRWRRAIPFGYRIHSPYQKDIGDVEACNGTLKDEWSPRNETTSENGSYTLQTGMAGSINTYFAQLEERTGVCRPATIARELGMTRADGKPLQQLKSFTLGTNEVSPLAMAEAYATFAARGEHCNADRHHQRGRQPRTTAQGPPGRLRAGAGQGHRRRHERLAPGRDDGGHGSPCRDLAGRRPARPGRRTSASPRGSSATPPSWRRRSGSATRRHARGGYPMYNRTIGGRYYASVCGGCLPGPDLARR